MFNKDPKSGKSIHTDSSLNGDESDEAAKANGINADGSQQTGSTGKTSQSRTLDGQFPTGSAGVDMGGGEMSAGKKISDQYR